MVWPYEVFREKVQSKLPADQIHDPAKITVPPYYPDTEVVRRELARFHDCVSVLNQQVGAILEQLEKDGLTVTRSSFFTPITVRACRATSGSFTTAGCTCR